MPLASTKGGKASGPGATGPKRVIGEVCVKLLCARNLTNKDRASAYVVCKLKASDEKDLVFRSRTIQRTLDPHWNEEFRFEVTDVSSRLQFKVWDEGIVRVFLGGTVVPVATLLDGWPRNEWHYLDKNNDKDLSSLNSATGFTPSNSKLGAGSIKCEMQFISTERRPCGLKRGVLLVTAVGARDLAPGKDRDPHLQLSLGNQQFSSKEAKGTQAPQWNESFLFEVGPESTTLNVTCWHDKSFMGKFSASLEDLFEGSPSRAWHKLEIRAKKVQEEVSGEVQLELLYVSNDAQYLEAGSKEKLTLEAFFPTLKSLVLSPIATHYFCKALDGAEEASLRRAVDALARLPKDRTPEAEAEAEAALKDLEPAYGRFLGSPLAGDLLAEATMTPEAAGARNFMRRVLPTFQSVLANQIALDSFQLFVSSEFAEENVLFYKAVVNFKSKFGHLVPPSDTLDVAARNIYEQYIATGSANEVNILSSLRSVVEKAIFSKGVTITVFDAVQTEVLKLLEEGPYSRWLAAQRVQAGLVKQLRTDEIAAALAKHFVGAEKILAHQAGRVAFTRYVKGDLGNASLLRFYEAAHDFSQKSVFNVNEARSIYNLHVKPNSSGDIKLPAEDLQRLTEQLDSAATAQRPPRDIFAPALTFAKTGLNKLMAQFFSTRAAQKFAVQEGIYP